MRELCFREVAAFKRSLGVCARFALVGSFSIALFACGNPNQTRSLPENVDDEFETQTPSSPGWPSSGIPSDAPYATLPPDPLVGPGNGVTAPPVAAAPETEAPGSENPQTPGTTDPQTPTAPETPGTTDPQTPTDPETPGTTDPQPPTDPETPGTTDPGTPTDPETPGTTEPVPPTDPETPGTTDPVPPTDPETPGTTDPEPPTDPDPTPPAPTEPPLSTGQIPDCTSGVMASFNLNSMQLPSENSNDYGEPTEARRMALRGSLDAFTSGDTSAAVSLASSATYSLCRGTGSESDLVLWKPPVGSGHAMVVLRTASAKPVILEAPHPLHDSKTVEESVVIFQRVKARALVASMTHRCAATKTSVCSGTTDACGGNNPYRISDQAHTDTGMFHAAHVALAERFASDLVMQIHGMRRDGASVSDGTSKPTDSSAPSARLAVALAKSFSGVTSCNAFGNVSAVSHLCGTTNTQGRHTNGIAVNACTSSAKSSNRRFIHLEQNRTLRDQPEKVADAINSIL